jgi:hypothetical protein
LCGSPWTPSIGGVRGGRTPNQLLINFMESQEKSQEANDFAAISRMATEEWITQDALEILRSQVKVLEREIARRKRRGPGRPWALPKRAAAYAGRDGLVLAVEQRGFTARRAKKAVAAVWNAMAAGLRKDVSSISPSRRILSPR